MGAQLTGWQLGGLIKQRRYDALQGQSAHAISLDGGMTWWEFYLEEREFAIGGAVESSLPALEEWNPIHAGLSYSVTELRPESDDPLLLVRFGFSELRYFIFRARMRPVLLTAVDRDGNSREVGTADGETLNVIEYLGRAEDILEDWRAEPQRALR